MRRLVPKMVLAATILALGACQQPDVGQPCNITWGTSDSASSPPNPVSLFQNHQSDWFESGNTECENLVCIVSPVAPGGRYAAGGYCSKPCVSNSDCFQSETGLVCRQMVLDPLFLAQLDQVDPTLKQKYLGDVQFSSYCGVPNP
jgi:hypothetical protein